MVLGQGVDLDVPRDFAIREIPAADGFIERRLAGGHEPGAGHQAEPAFGQGPAQGRPRHGIDAPPRIHLEKQADGQRQIVEGGHGSRDQSKSEQLMK